MNKTLTAIGSIVFGGIIYVAWRSENLLMFSWFEYLNLTTLIKYTREFVRDFSYFPQWFYYSLPNALWVFGGTSLYCLIWKEEYRFERAIWIVIFWSINTFAEIGQIFGIISGTFDSTDLLLSLVFGAMALVFSKRRKLL